MQNSNVTLKIGFILILKLIASTLSNTEFKTEVMQCIQIGCFAKTLVFNLGLKRKRFHISLRRQYGQCTASRPYRQPTFLVIGYNQKR